MLHRTGLINSLLAGLLTLPVALSAASQPAPQHRPVPASSVESGVRWLDLTASQRAALKPLERDWSGIDASGKSKWLELSSRVPSMSSDERTRIHARMSDWAKLSPQERGRARLNFEEAKQLPTKDRQARWEAYQALPPERKRELAARTEPYPPGVAGHSTRRTGVAGVRADSADTLKREVPQGKSNIVPNPAFAAPPKPVAPTIVQAHPGATTTLISKRPSPPSHQQTGLPKIAATPEFVDKSTLLPQRGPQGAATRPAAVPDQQPAKRK